MNSSVKTFVEMMRRLPQNRALIVLEEGTMWDILSALRGPDNDDCKLKARTTEVIRAVVTPWIDGNANVAFGHTQFKILAADLADNGPYHFINHVTLAAKHLGLIDIEAYEAWRWSHAARVAQPVFLGRSANDVLGRTKEDKAEEQEDIPEEEYLEDADEVEGDE